MQIIQTEQTTEKINPREQSMNKETLDYFQWKY